MTDDQVIAFAHESDECLNKKGCGVYAFSFDELKRAFEAVAAHEREACAKAVDGYPNCSESIRARSPKGAPHE